MYREIVGGRGFDCLDLKTDSNFFHHRPTKPKEERQNKTP